MLIVVFIVVPVPSYCKQSLVMLKSNVMVVKVSRLSIIVHPVELSSAQLKKDMHFAWSVLI